ncbi:MAG: hypothetical protein AAGE43_02205 [Pseudomonadota bacterium]
MASTPPVQIITLEIQAPFSFEAGQYLEVLHPDGTAIPLSIASPPEQLPRLTLHYRSTAGVDAAARMDELLKQSELTLVGGAGDVVLEPSDRSSLLLVAGGTGISQALCLAIAQTLRHPGVQTELLACADEAGDLYFEDLLPETEAFTARLISDSRRDARNAGLSWLRDRAQTLCKNTRVILSGSPAFVYAATDMLTDAGVGAGQLASDVYAWAPR